MARIVLGIGTSHGPQLSMPPDQWSRRADWDRRNPALWFRGRTYAYPDLLEVRAGEHFEREIVAEKAEARYAACQKDIAALAETFAQVKPDVAVVIGDDQEESFLDDNMPAICVYWGESIENAALSQDQRRAQVGIAGADWGHHPPARAAYPGQADLGQHIIQCLIREEFDPAQSRKLPPGRRGDGGIGHAFGFVYRRMMNDQVIPNVPVLLNTYYPPNQPTLRRCYELGRALRRAIESWESDKTVAVVASGGLTHFVIEEELDQQVLAAFKARNTASLANLPGEWFNSGTSEIRNWVVAAAAAEEAGLEPHVIDYVPCYRSEAGTGCAMAFAHWR